MRVLVTGATGFVGGRLVPELLERGHEVVALVRDASGYDSPDGVEVVEADLLEPDSLPPAMDVDAAFYLVHSMHGGSDYAERDRQAAEYFQAAADEAGVERVVYLGGLGGDEDELSEHLRSRREIERVLDDGDYDLTVLRAAIVIGAGSTSFEMVRQLATRLPVMITPKWVRTRVQPIGIDDVVAYLAGVLEVPETADDVFEVGGPTVLSYEEVLVRTSTIAAGRPPLVVPVPVLSPQLSAYWVDLVTSVPAQVAHPLILGLRNEVVVSDHRIEDLVEVDRTPFEETVRRALAEGDA